MLIDNSDDNLKYVTYKQPNKRIYEVIKNMENPSIPSIQYLNGKHNSTSKTDNNS